MPAKSIAVGTVVATSQYCVLAVIGTPVPAKLTVTSTLGAPAGTITVFKPPVIAVPGADPVPLSL